MDLSQFSIIIQQSINAVSLGAIYALFALGYALVFSILGVLNLAHSAIFMWGAFVGLLALDPLFAPILVAFTIAMIPMSFVGAGLEVGIFQRALPKLATDTQRVGLRLSLTIVLLLIFQVLQPEITFNVVIRFYGTFVSVGIGLALLLAALRYVLRTGQDNVDRLSNLLLRIVLLAWLWVIGDVIFTALLNALPAELQFAPLIALILAIVGGGLMSILLELTAFRPLRERNAKRLAQLISSIGASLVLVNLAQFAFQQLFNRTEAYYPRGVALLPGLATEPIIQATAFGELRITPIRLVIFIIALVLMVLLQYMVTRTRIGQQMRAVAFNQRIASLLGIDVSQVYLVTFFLAGAFGGVAGMMYGLVFSNITPFIGDNLALIGLTAIVLGGLGSINGAVLGGFIVAALQTFSVAAGGSSYRDAIVFILLFLVLLIRPQGLLGQPENTRA